MDIGPLNTKIGKIENLIAKFNSYKGRSLLEALFKEAGIGASVEEEEVSLFIKEQAKMHREGRRISLKDIKNNNSLIIEVVLVELPGSMIGVYYLILQLICNKVFEVIKKDLSSKHLTYLD